MGTARHVCDNSMDRDGYRRQADVLIFAILLIKPRSPRRIATNVCVPSLSAPTRTWTVTARALLLSPSPALIDGH